MYSGNLSDSSLALTTQWVIAMGKIHCCHVRWQCIVTFKRGLGHKGWLLLFISQARDMIGSLSDAGPLQRTGLQDFLKRPARGWQSMLPRLSILQRQRTANICLKCATRVRGLLDARPIVRLAVTLDGRVSLRSRLINYRLCTLKPWCLHVIWLLGPSTPLSRFGISWLVTFQVIFSGNHRTIIGEYAYNFFEAICRCVAEDMHDAGGDLWHNCCKQCKLPQDQAAGSWLAQHCKLWTFFQTSL